MAKVVVEIHVLKHYVYSLLCSRQFCVCSLPLPSEILELLFAALELRTRRRVSRSAMGEMREVTTSLQGEELTPPKTKVPWP